MDRKILAVNIGLWLFTLYFAISFAIDVVMLYKVLFLFDKMGAWTLGITNLFFGKMKWKIAMAIGGLGVFHFILALYANRLRIRRSDRESITA
jgi:hypothetical protein